MAENTNIEWCDHTHNPWIGCTKVGPGCDHCYAEKLMDHRMHKAKWGAGQERVRTTAGNWKKPIQWNSQHAAFFAKHGRRQRVFCASLADVFDNEVPEQWRVQLFDLIYSTPNLDWLLLTKRIGNVASMLPSYRVGHPMHWGDGWPNVWIGATFVNQEEIDRDISKLVCVPAAVHFMSVEPLLGPVVIPDVFMKRLFLNGRAMDYPDDAGMVDWVIVGGESGPGARPMHPDWARGLRDQCKAAGVPFLFKQWGEHSLTYDRDHDDPDYQRCGEMDRRPGRWINIVGGHGFSGKRVHYAERVGKKAAGRLLDGVEWSQYPK